jgi:hypothetical protein
MSLILPCMLIIDLIRGFGSIIDLICAGVEGLP